MIEPEELERGLERLGERISPRDDARERLERRFVRRRVARKAGTVAPSLLVAVVGVSAASVAFIGRHRVSGRHRSRHGCRRRCRRCGQRTGPTLPLLRTKPPRNGSPIPGIRARPGEPTRSRSLVASRPSSSIGSGSVGFMSLSPSSARGAARGVSVTVSCGHPCGRATILLTQPQRPGPGGIWSVTAVADPRVALSVHGTEGGVGGALALTVGESRARVALSMGQGFAGRGGDASTDGCTKTESSSPPFGPPGGRWETMVPPPGAATETRPGRCGTMQSAYLFGPR